MQTLKTTGQKPSSKNLGDRLGQDRFNVPKILQKNHTISVLFDWNKAQKNLLEGETPPRNKYSLKTVDQLVKQRNTTPELLPLLKLNEEVIYIGKPEKQKKKKKRIKLNEKGVKVAKSEDDIELTKTIDVQEYILINDGIEKVLPIDIRDLPSEFELSRTHVSRKPPFRPYRANEMEVVAMHSSEGRRLRGKNLAAASGNSSVLKQQLVSRFNNAVLDVRLAQRKFIGDSIMNTKMSHFKTVLAELPQNCSAEQRPSRKNPPKAAAQLVDLGHKDKENVPPTINNETNNMQNNNIQNEISPVYSAADDLAEYLSAHSASSLNTRAIETNNRETHEETKTQASFSLSPQDQKEQTDNSKLILKSSLPRLSPSAKEILSKTAAAKHFQFIRNKLKQKHQIQATLNNTEQQEQALVRQTDKHEAESQPATNSNTEQQKQALVKPKDKYKNFARKLAIKLKVARSELKLMQKKLVSAYYKGTDSHETMLAHYHHQRNILSNLKRMEAAIEAAHDTTRAHVQRQISRFRDSIERSNAALRLMYFKDMKSSTAIEEKN